MLERAIALILAAVAPAGCNTMSGMGRGIERGGQELQQEARQAQRR